MRQLAPTLKKGKPNNDYGRGFYCTGDVEMAREWACNGERPPAYVHSYELNTKGLIILDLSQLPFSVLNWIAVLLANRTFQTDLEVAVTVRNYLLANFMPPTMRQTSSSGTAPTIRILAAPRPSLTTDFPYAG